MPAGGDQSFSVLFVECDPDALDLVKKSLEENLQYPSSVEHAATVGEALEKLKNNSYDILLVESELEDENGLSLLEEMQRKQMNLPFVLMTPIRDDRLVKEAMKQGVADLIVKSENHFQELAAKLRRIYERFYQKTGSAVPPVKPRERHGKNGRDRPEAKVDILRPSMKDELTGLYNHSYLQDRIVREFSRASRYGYPLSCLMIDIDQFKALNEEKGYRIGDALLKECAALLFENCRLSDFIARYGGEEFVVILPHVDYQGAADLAGRLRVTFAEHLFCRDSEEIYLTVSIGVSSFPEDKMERRSDLMIYAGEALLRSKTSGRNRVSLYQDILPVFGEEGLPDLKISEAKVMEFQRRMSEISNTARRAYIDASKALITALENKDRFTAGHAASCAKYSMQVAEAMGMSVDEAEVVEHAALLHDIGKICIPDNILLKPGKLTFAEFEAMKQHPYMGYKILKPIKFLREEAVLVLHHHEWFNGEGYPCRLKGNEIPLGARIISVIDSYDTMRIAGGRYKKTMTVADAVNELIACSVTQFDTQVVKAFVEVLKVRGELVGDDYHKSRLDELLAAAAPPAA